jgi:hypothetical protein
MTASPIGKVAVFLFTFASSVQFVTSAIADSSSPEPSRADNPVAGAARDASLSRSTGWSSARSAFAARFVPECEASSAKARPAARFARLRVLLLGDSMTAGDEDSPTSFRSYRGTLYNLLRAAGHDVDFVGPNHLPPAVGGDPDHAAFGGAEIGPGANPNNVSDRLASILNGAGRVDVVIVALGWNSVFNEPAEAARKYERLATRLSAMRPNATLILATLSPPRGQSEKEAAASSSGYRELNAKARLMASRSMKDKLILADLAAIPFSAEDFWDVIHWRQSGADKAARAIFVAMTGNAAILTSGQ